MRKSALFISAALTAFTLAVLFGVVTAYQNSISDAQAAQPPAVDVAQLPVNEPAQVPQQAPTQIPTPPQLSMITAEQAVSIASDFLGKTDLYSVEMTQFEGADVYLVTFSSGDLVYVSLDGQIASTSKLATTVIQLPNNGGRGVRNSPEKPSRQEGGEHEHEGGDD